MAQTSKWARPEAIATALTTELNALANGTLSAASSTIANETDLFQFINYELVLASLTPAVGAFFIVAIIPTLDGTNFYDFPIANLDRWSTTIVVDTATGAKRLGKENVPIPPLDFKHALYNQAGVALGATGNTLKYRRHNGQAV